MAPTPKYVTDLLAAFGQVVERLTAVEKQNEILSDLVHELGEEITGLNQQVQLLSSDQSPATTTTTSMARTFRYNMPKRTNPGASIRWVLADALPDHTEEELKALFKDFGSMALKACTIYANSEGNPGASYTKVPAQGKSVMQQTALDLLLKAHEELSFLHECESYWPVGFAIQNSWTEFAKRHRKREALLAARAAARNASAAS